MEFPKMPLEYQHKLFNRNNYNMKKGDDFLLTCKQNYFEKIRPGDLESKEKVGYKKLVEIAKEYFRNNEYEIFAGFFQEGQYFIALWAAHLVLEYGTANQAIVSSALSIIKDYSDNPLAPDVAVQETLWLKANIAKYNGDK